MNRQPFEKPPRWWGPKISPAWYRFWRLLGRREQLRTHRLLDVQVRELSHLRDAVDAGHGVLITPNHSSHADCFPLNEAADALGIPFHVMVAWQVFQRGGPIRRLALQHSGCFSVDREGTDRNALRTAREILQSSRYPLVIFPEGEIYHINERLTPFREGPAAIALLAAKKAKRPIVCLPCAIHYTYIDDPTPELVELAARLEQALLWRPRPDRPLPERIYRLAEGVLALKELEFLGHTCAGPIPRRIGGLIEAILQPMETRYSLDAAGETVPERVKALRREAIKRLEDLGAEENQTPPDAARSECLNDLDDLFVVVQAFSYPGDYVAQGPSLERIAETLDKFEEDVLGVKTATIRGSRRATITFGDPVPVVAGKNRRAAAAVLTRTLEERVQALLD